MAISALTGSKFLEDSYTLFKNGVTAVATHGNISANNMLSLNQDIRWQTVGANNDSTTGTVVITLPAATIIDRIYFTGHNLKAYTIKHDSSVDFTNVKSFETALAGGIVETAYDKNTSYYEFDPVSVTTITLSYSSTQIADQEKYIAVFIATEELGTFAYPYTVVNSFSRNARVAKTISGKQTIQKNYEFYTGSISAEYIPSVSQSDVTLLENLHTRETPFIFWPCGGHYGSNYFSLSVRGWRLQDIYKCQLTSAYSAPFIQSLWVCGVGANLTLEEVV